MAISEMVTNPPTAIAVGVGSSAINTLVTTLPLLINVATVVYLAVLILYTSWKFYRDYKAKKNEPSQ